LIPERWTDSRCAWRGAPALVLAAILAGCAATGGGAPEDSVRVVTAEQLRGCTNVGSAHVSVVDNLAELQKVEGAVAGKLIALAKNSALQLGGNAIVEMTNIVDGSQSFAVFNCP
jgi:hypothetical protein